MDPTAAIPSDTSLEAERVQVALLRAATPARRFGLARCRYHGELGMERWVGLGILAHNLCQISHTLIIRRAA